MTFQIRPYQSDAIAAVLKFYQQRKRQLLLRLPTGAGKTVISALLIEKLLELIGDKRILFLTHRREIVDQSRDKIVAQIGAQFVTIEQADRSADPHARVVIASIQTLTGRLGGYDASTFGVVIVDECHHAFAKTWMDTIGHFGKNPDTLVLGLTATPKRSDGRCISQLFHDTAFEISLGELQDLGYLVPMNYFTIEASLGLSDVPVDKQGDFQATLLGKIMNTPEMRAITLRACFEKALAKKTIAFCASVSHAEDLAKDFAAAGVTAACITGQNQDRDSTIARFRSGDIQILTNFGVLTEGFDDPSIECVLLARPTTSPLVYSQCLGRGLRSHPGKASCIVIDIVDRQRHQLQYNAFEAAGLPRSWLGSGKDPLREAEAIARIRVTDPQAFLKLRNALSLTETHKILMNLDPATVLAGIDGMPLLHYRPIDQEFNVGPEARLSRAEGILRVAGWIPTELVINGNSLEAVFTTQGDHGPSPYLAWHLVQATGWQLVYTLVAPPAIAPTLLNQTSEVAAPALLLDIPGKSSGPLSESIRVASPSTKPFAAPVTSNAASLTPGNLELKAQLAALAKPQGEGASAAANPPVNKIPTEKRLNLMGRLEAMKGESDRKSAAGEPSKAYPAGEPSAHAKAPKSLSIQDKLRALKGDREIDR